MVEHVAGLRVWWFETSSTTTGKYFKGIVTRDGVTAHFMFEIPHGRTVEMALPDINERLVAYFSIKSKEKP